MHSSALRSLALGFAILLLLSACASSTTVETFDPLERSRAVDTLLRRGEYAEALRLSIPLLDHVGSRSVAPGTGSEESLGSVMGLHALALAGMAAEGAEEARRATYYWTLAQSLAPDLRTDSLEAYGAAGDRLSPIRLDDDCKLRQPVPGLTVEPRDVWDGMEAPRKLQGPQPGYTRHAREAGVEGTVSFSAVIDDEGRLGLPCVLDTDSAVFAYMLSQVLDDWRFEPATVDGEAVSVYYRLTTGFQLGRP